MKIEKKKHKTKEAMFSKQISREFTGIALIKVSKKDRKITKQKSISGMPTGISCATLKEKIAKKRGYINTTSTLMQL